MLNVESLIKSTDSYKIFVKDKKAKRLSHAYLLISPDPVYMREYLKVYAKTVFCDEDEFCNNCRTCKLIEEEKHIDVKFFPEDPNGKIKAEDIDFLVEDSFLKPYEGNKKLYVITDVAVMNAPSQNKLLKTLEEPSNGVHVLIGASNEFSALPTVKSRVNTLRVPLFTPEELMVALRPTCTDELRLKNACINSNGTVGDAEKIYGSEDLLTSSTLAEETVLNLKNSKDVFECSKKVIGKVDTKEFLSALSVIYRDMELYLLNGKPFATRNYEALTEGYNPSSVVYALDKTTEAIKRLSFYNNETMLIERLFLSILEGKYIWKK